MSELIQPILTVDVIPLVIIADELHIVLQMRDRAPFAGSLALLGGYVHPTEDETTTDAAIRVLQDKAGLSAQALEQLMTFSGRQRDPRGWSASIVYYALITEQDVQNSQKNLSILPLSKMPPLPFDHNLIIERARDRLRRRAAYSTLAGFLLPPEFTLSALRRAYEIALGRSLNDSAFRRKVDELRMIEQIEGATSKSSDRPAKLYRLCRLQVTEFDRTF